MLNYWEFYPKGLHPLSMNEDVSLYNTLRIYMGDPLTITLV